MKTLLLSLAFAVAVPVAANATPASAPVAKAKEGCCKDMGKDKKMSCCEKMKKEAASKAAADPHADHDMSK